MYNTKNNQNFTNNWLAIKSGDKEALDRLYVENFPKVRDYVMKNNGSEEQAKDVYQEAFISVWRNIQLDKFTPENDHSLVAYLVKVAKFKWIDFLRSRNYRDFTSLQEDLPTDGQVSEDEEEEKYFKLVKKHFDTLDDNCREILKRFYFYGQSMEEIGKRFKWTKETTRNNKYRCLKKLRELINNTL